MTGLPPRLFRPCVRYGPSTVCELWLAPAIPGVSLEAQYLALGLANLVLSLSPQRIILGGGVTKHAAPLHRLVRERVARVLNGYVRSPMLAEGLDEYLVPPTLEGRSGAMGALALAIDLDRELGPGRDAPAL